MNRRQRRAAAKRIGEPGPDPTVGSGATSAALFNAALRYHNSGRLTEAELLYGQVLATEPRHARSLHNLGNILRETSRASDAVTCYERALALEPNLALVHDLAIVTKTGALMRGRHTRAILQMMGVTDTITDTVDDYVSTAVHLARDVSERMALRKRIAESKSRLYRDDSFIFALEEFLVQVAHQG
jgi:tetratricopeptide (TPR) repeat protein